ncbi:alpha-E domain-containing protein [Lutibacter sp.]|uniref:alpha-E domain-containing protein n=1 Tax=Lutibacter sp. TaxID=1925666 RepID=UPI0035692FDE
MLARVANNLFWMGRYIERSEHLARYLNVNYFSSLDAPTELSQSRQFVLRSIMYMANNEIVDKDIKLKEEDVLYNVGLNPENQYSIIYSFSCAHENAKSSRDLISTELFESLNRINHSIKGYSPEAFVKNGLYDFTSMITQFTSELRSKIQGTLLHDEIHAIIMLGVYLERALQLTRIINSKCSDYSAEEKLYKNKADTNHQWSTLLKCVASYDMMRRFYKKTPTKITTLEFLILNSECPRSIINCLNQIDKNISILAKTQKITKDSPVFLIGKLKAEFEYKLIDEIDDNIESFISNLITKLVTIGEKLEENYFKISDHSSKTKPVAQEQ